MRHAFSACSAALLLCAGLGTGSATAANGSAYACPSAQTSSGTLNCAALPLGDRNYSLNAPQRGWIYACSAGMGMSPVRSAPWINATSWNLLTKVVVQGSVSWPGAVSVAGAGATRTITTNSVPVSPYTTGTFPISFSDPARQYDRNPNSVAQHNHTYRLPAGPAIAATPSCLGMGAIAVTLTGVLVYDAFDAAGGDAVAREEQDLCHGHPDRSSTYHYHGILQACVSDSGSATRNSSLLAYAFDGFGIYGPWYNGKILTTADLDVCHGITSPVMWDGRLLNIYHYVSTYDFPYTLGCFRGTPVS